jgi:deoxycytidylate deaminase
MKITKNVRLLQEISLATPKIADAKVAAAIIIKNRIISIGVNSHKTHPIQAKFAANKGLSIYLHAEIAAIKNAMYHIDVKDFRRSTLLICRTKIHVPTGAPILGMSKPCPGCQRAILEFDIKNVWYSLDDGGFERL